MNHTESDQKIRLCAYGSPYLATGPSLESIDTIDDPTFPTLKKGEKCLRFVTVEHFKDARNLPADDDEEDLHKSSRCQLAVEKVKEFCVKQTLLIFITVASFGAAAFLVTLGLNSQKYFGDLAAMNNSLQNGGNGVDGGDVISSNFVRSSAVGAISGSASIPPNVVRQQAVKTNDKKVSEVSGLLGKSNSVPDLFLTFSIVLRILF
jgi:hypothetical protein